MTEYRMKIGGIEIFVDSSDAVLELIRKCRSEEISIEGGAASKTNTDSASGSTMDRVILKKFIENDRKGIPSTQLAQMLGSTRKALQDDLTKFANKVGLSGNFETLFERNIYQGARGYRLSIHATEAAKIVLSS